MCRADGERPKRRVGHPADEMDLEGRRAKGSEGRTSRGSGRIRKGFGGGAWRRTELVKGFRQKKEKWRKRSQFLS